MQIARDAFHCRVSVRLDPKSDTSLRCPLRQTLPIFKQPVTYYPTQRDEVKPQVTNASNSATGSSAGKPSEKTKPRQLFWEKRFQNIRPTDIDGQPFDNFKLPEQIKGTHRSVLSVQICLTFEHHSTVRTSLGREHFSSVLSIVQMKQVERTSSPSHHHDIDRTGCFLEGQAVQR